MRYCGYKENGQACGKKALYAWSNAQNAARCLTHRLMQPPRPGDAAEALAREAENRATSDYSPPEPYARSKGPHNIVERLQTARKKGYVNKAKSTA
jgi:hypothetical protein